MTDQILIALLSLGITVLIIVMFYNKLSSINKNVRKTKFMLFKIHEQSGGNLSEEEKRFYNS